MFPSPLLLQILFHGILLGLLNPRDLTNHWALDEYFHLDLASGNNHCHQWILYHSSFKIAWYSKVKCVKIFLFKQLVAWVQVLVRQRRVVKIQKETCCVYLAWESKGQVQDELSIWKVSGGRSYRRVYIHLVYKLCSSL